MVKEFEGLIDLINLSIYGTEVSEEKIRNYEWEKILEEARVHNCWSIVFPAVKHIQEKYNVIDTKLYEKWKNVSILIAAKQCAKNYELGHVIKLLEKNNIFPVVFKGVVIAKLYPEYLLRASGDADILVDEQDMEKAKQLLLEDGFFIDEAKSKPDVPAFEKKDTLLIEMHSCLWEGRSDKTIELLESMKLTDRSKMYRFYGCDLESDTLGYTEHLVYIIYHMIKHLIPGGIGIRHLLDITLYVNAYYDKLDIEKLNFCISRLGYEKVCYSLFKICVKYLNMTDKILMGREENITNLELELLDDIKDAGVFGTRTEERGKTIDIVRQTYYEQGKNKKMSKAKILINTMFPSADTLSDRYVNAKKHKMLLPVAWCQRVIFHLKQKKKNKNEPNLFEKAHTVEKRITMLESLGLSNSIE